MILREMPAIWDEKFRPWFYERWGRENCVIAARTRDAHYPQFRQRLSIKAAWGGRECYFVDGRRIPVDDETFLILNDGRTYSSSLRSPTPVISFSIFFRPAMEQEVACTLHRGHEFLLNRPDAQAGVSIEFSEQIRRNERRIAPVLRFILRHVDAGLTDEDWYEEQLYFLMQRLLQQRNRDGCAETLIAAARRATRQELSRRAALAADFINANFAARIDLRQIAAAAVLSPFHCLRVFKSAYGRTPLAYLNERRVQCALRLLRQPGNSIDEVASRAGFHSRATLFRHMKRSQGAAPSALRNRADL